MQVTSNSNNKVRCEELKLAECGEVIAIAIAIETATASQKVTKSSEKNLEW